MWAKSLVWPMTSNETWRGCVKVGYRSEGCDVVTLKFSHRWRGWVPVRKCWRVTLKVQSQMTWHFNVWLETDVARSEISGEEQKLAWRNRNLAWQLKGFLSGIETDVAVRKLTWEFRNLTCQIRGFCQRIETDVSDQNEWSLETDMAGQKPDVVGQKLTWLLIDP